MLFLPFMTFLPQSFLPLTHAVLPSSACFPQGGLWCPSPVDAPFGLWILLDPGIPPDTPASALSLLPVVPADTGPECHLLSESPPLCPLLNWTLCL